MRIIQIIQLPYTAPVSGADLRNEALLRSLLQAGRASQMAVGDRYEDNPAPDMLAAVVSENPDIVVVEGVGLLAWAKALRHALPPQTRIVFDFHNVESALLEAQDRVRLPAPFGVVAPLLYGHRWRTAREADRAAIALADAVWTCTPQDQALARSLGGPGMQMSVIPNPVPFWCTEGGAASLRCVADDPDILFVGHLRYPPNKRAVRRLVRQIMPALARRFPRARLTVSGRSPNDRLIELVQASPLANLVADPADLAPLYRKADMVLLPLSEGGGSRIKVLEALAVGCPVVATTKAVEGLGLEPGRHYLAAETSAEFVAATEKLIREPALGERLRTEGMTFALAEHGAAAIAECVEAALAALDQS